ncbi:hypothetical protein Trydic_g18488 [Trypoxylus dichotomus]
MGTEANFSPNSLVVMDNAPYYNVVTNKIPNTLSRKHHIADWLTNRNSVSSDLIKVELLDIVKRNKSEKQYVIEEMIKSHGHEVWGLPPYHFNVIELIWASVKGYYNKNIGGDGYRDENALNVWNEVLEHYTPNTWENCKKLV